MQTSVKFTHLLLACSFALSLCSGCNSDVRDDDTEVDSSSAPITGIGEPAKGSGTDSFVLTVSNAAVIITEGQEQIVIPVSVTRSEMHDADIRLTAVGKDVEDELLLTSQYSDDILGSGETDSELLINLAIGPQPIQQHVRTLLIAGTDATGQSSATELKLQVLPTNAPDVYLLIGQSNMVGISQFQAKESAPGQLDAPNDRIKQLNVTFNDIDNFSQPSDFTNPNSLYNVGNSLTAALDPLHSGMEGDNTKSGTQIGLGLSFAKRALQNTTADIYLVPAAWSDTGFCKRDTALLPDTGWNATVKANPALSGTLLHDRAIKRADAALSLTNGVLRGILWHQGEADADDSACAQSYAQNLTEMIRSLRSNIAVDARGPSARGPEADIPFIVGTMAKGGAQAPFSPLKTLIDDTHRNIANSVKFADFVNNDDLLPPAYDCGGGSCIHFGAAALREMGVRYFDRLDSVIP